MSNGAAMPLQECDIIMKGGITSGVVYPRAILRLSQKYRFRNIGGTSAGAIAAVVSAAAEYNRAGHGFKVIEDLPPEVEKILKTLFQPSPSVRAVFNAALCVMEKRYLAALGGLLLAYWLPFAVGFVPFAVLAAVLLGAGNGIAALILLLLAPIAGAVVMALVIAKGTIRNLTQLDFGFCPGRTQNGSQAPALSDWLADKIELAAGRMTPGGSHPQAPLTFADVWAGLDRKGSPEQPAINLRMMTTNLSLRRPNALPFMDGNHYFKEQEFRRLFPDWIVDYLVAAAKEIETDTPPPPGCLPFPSGGRMPLVVAARMSLSFPILFSTVPLYRYNFPAGNPAPVERMLFSDGGLSSNFPVHFFDALLPSRPTFGISLEEFDETRPKRRVHLPMKAVSGIWLDRLAIDSLPTFLMTLVNSAKDWQDRLQSTLPGYRERIASAYLHPDEGGLNLTMPPNIIARLIELGDRAGALMTGTPADSNDSAGFDFDDHRWRRYLVAFARIEETLQVAAKSWGNAQTAGSFGHFIRGYMADPASYKSKPPQWPGEVFARFDALMQMSASWPSPLRAENEGHNIPRPHADMRITPKP